MADPDIATRRAQVAALDAALTRLRREHDLLMNRFEFDAARALAPRIEAAARDRDALAATLPPPAEATQPPAPFTVRHRRRR